jgi:hypothetical protein
MLQRCPNCNGARFVEAPSSGLLLPCPMCDATGVDPGVEDFFVYVFDLTITAGVGARNDNQKVVIDGSAGFRWKALTGTQAFDYRVRFRQQSGAYMSSGGIGGSNDLVNNANIVGTAQFPFPILPHPMFPPSGHILQDFENRNAGANTIQIAFIGAKVVPTSP